MSVELNPRSVLALAPHPDDVELGMGGTISKLVENGSDIRVLVFSLADKSLPPGFSPDDIKAECLAALGKLGIKEGCVRFLNYPVREFSSYRQEILEDLVDLSRSYGPDLVFCPSLNDIHQDHGVIASESLRAFKKTTVLGYELPWNCKKFDSSLSISLEERHIDAKEASLQCYRSQAARPYFDKGLLKNHSRMRATVVGLEYAESFELIRMVLR
jgi:LmbE family N-acetylglucosaminyl deacetylase